MVDKIEFTDLDIEELPATSSVLVAGAHHMGKYCENDFKSYMQRRFEAKDPRATLEEGKRVTQCALEFFRKMKETCNTQFTNHWKCLDYHNQMYGNCRHTQKPYDTCVLQNFGLVTDQPVHIEGEI